MLPGDWEGRVREEWITRGHKESFGDKGYVHYLHGGDDLTNAYMSKFTTVCFKCLLSKIHQLLSIKLVKKIFFLQRNDIRKATLTHHFRFSEFILEANFIKKTGHLLGA